MLFSTTLAAAAALGSLASLTSAAGLEGPFEPGRVAPPFAGVTWHDAPAAEGTAERQVVRSAGLDTRRPEGHGYPAWHGFVVLVLVLPEGSATEALALGELAARANEDRGLVVVTVQRAPTPAAEGEEEPGFTPPSATLLAGTADESSAWHPDGATRAVILGPTGEVVGAARVPGERDVLLTLLEDALNRFPAAPLAADLGAAVRPALREYFAGEWDTARRSAEKLAKKLERADPDGAAAARSLVAKVDEHERALRAALVESSGSWMGSADLAALVAAIRRGFPRSKAADEAELVADQQLQDMARETAFRVATAWVDALPERPALFPDVADSRGKRYAKRLEALTKMATFDGDLTRRAKALLMRFELAAAR